MPENARPAREVAEALVDRLAHLDFDGFADLFAPDAVFDYPFGWPGAPSRFSDREALRAHLLESRRDVGSLIEVRGCQSVVHETVDPEVVVLELEVEGVTVATGRPFRFASGISVVTVRGGAVVRYRDYTNPVGAAEVTGRLPALAARLAQP